MDVAKEYSAGERDARSIIGRFPFGEIFPAINTRTMKKRPFGFPCERL